MLPRDPVILLSTVNTRLRDMYSDLAALCEGEGCEREDIDKALNAIGYYYDESANAYK